jgi:peptide/nickel transport system substrate-binding protein
VAAKLVAGRVNRGLKVIRSLTGLAVPMAIGIALVVGCGGDSRGDKIGPAPPASSAAPARGGELVASIRAEPDTYNRYVDQKAAGEVLALLTQASLVQVDRRTDTLEPWLAEGWTESDDHLTYTLKLRPGIVFSDGVPLTSADVLFSFRALYDPKVNSVIAADTLIDGKPVQVSAPDAATVVLRFPAPFAPGLRLVDGIRILPRHKLEPALLAGTFRDAWSVKTPLTDIVGLGPFVLAEHAPGQRLVFTRNPHYWRRDAAGIALPYLDRLTLAVANQTTEALRLQAGEIDLMANADIRSEDYAAFKRAADAGRVRLIDAGVGLDPNLLWFNLSSAQSADHRNTWLRHKAFRQGVSCVVDRQAIVNAVYLGAAVPVFGPITPANATWYADVRPACEHDPQRARELFGSAGLSDRNGDGLLDDASGKAARFSILTQADNVRARVGAVIQEQLRQAGITVDLVLLDQGAMFKRYAEGQYDSIYFGVQASATDPALNPGFWLSSGNFHFWNPEQKSPATEWERRIDTLMHQQGSTPDLAQRKRLFVEVQRILADELPAIYFVTPKVTLAVSTRVANPQPAPQLPQLLWSADTLAFDPTTRQTRE